MSTKQAQIDRFLSLKRIAVIGVSRDEKAYSRLLFREFVKQGYDAVPINPNAQELDGKRCPKSIRDVSPPPGAAVIVLPEAQREVAVQECLAVGVNNIWVYGKLKADVAGQLSAGGRETSLNLISNLCPFMFFPQASWIHRFHAKLMKLVGTYPC